MLRPQPKRSRRSLARSPLSKGGQGGSRVHWVRRVDNQENALFHFSLFITLMQGRARAFLDQHQSS